MKAIRQLWAANGATRRRGAWIAVTLALCVSLAAGAACARAQTPDPAEDLAAFAPALLPAFAGDMAAHASAPRYTIDLALTLGAGEAALDGHQQVHYTNRTPGPLDEIVFRLYPNLRSYGGEMVVTRVTVDGAAVAPDLDPSRTVLSVPLPQPLAPGADTTLALDFEVRVPAGQISLYGQFSYIDGVLALPNAYPVLSVYEPSAGWWDVTAHPQGDAVYSETAFYEVTLGAPENLIIAASGTEIEVRAGEAAGTLAQRG